MCDFKSGYDKSQMFPMTWLLWLIDSVYFDFVTVTSVMTGVLPWEGLFELQVPCQEVSLSLLGEKVFREISIYW